MCIRDRCTTAVEEAVGSFNGPDLSDATTDHWYTLKSARGSKYATAASGTLTGVAGAFSVSYGDNVWKFVKRSDETLDIINANGLYITPNSTSTAAITLSESSPATGWEISYSTHTTGNVTIGSVINSTTNCQLNQSTGTNVLNWHNGYPNRTDEGCSYTLAAYDGLILDPSEKLTSGWYELQCASYTNTKTVEDAYSCKNYVGQYIINGDSELEQTTATPYNYYPLQYSTTQPTNAPKAWVYITVDGSTYKFTSSNGHGVQENCTASYESLPTSNPTVAAVSKDDNGIQYTISHWSQFGGYVGAASATLNTFYIRPVDTTGYDEWTVTIARPGTTAKVGKNISITLNNTANKGIATVFNGGKYFLTSGATIAESEITVNDPESLASGKTAIIAVDPTEKTIKVTYPADETTLSSGWYRIHMVDSYTANRGTPTTTQSNVCSGLGDNTYLINADAEFWQTATNSYALKYGAKPSDDKEATAFIYVDVNSDASQWMFTSSNGHVVAENCTSYRTGSGTLGDGSYSPALDKQRNAVYRIGNWSTYGEYVGKSSSHASHFQFEPISTDAYDIYTVSITSNNTAEANASNIAQDSYLFFKSSKNKGAATAYNGGKFFVTKGTEITSDDLQFMACSSDYLVPSCTIDANNKKITVDFTSDQSGVTAFNLTEGWYSFSLTGQVSYGSTITETNRRLFNNWIADAVSTDKEYMLASDTHYSNYHVVMGGKPAEEKAAMAFFYVVPASNGSSIQIRSIDGYWMADNAQAATSAGSASITANSVQKGVYSFNFGPYYNHTFSAPLHPVGKYGNVNFAWKLTPADMTNYDVIQVTLKKGDSAVNGVKIGLSTAEASTVQLAPAMRRAASTDEITNYGLQEVYNGGYFIVNKGANVTADNLSITAYDGNSTPAISTVIDTNGNVTGFTVDYGDTATGITDLDAEPQGEAVIYDLQGRRVKNPTHGIYIINGRKTLLR